MLVVEIVNLWPGTEVHAQFSRIFFLPQQIKLHFFLIFEDERSIYLKCFRKILFSLKLVTGMCYSLLSC